MPLYTHDGRLITDKEEYATTFAEMTRGLMFRRELDGALIFVMPRPIREAVHMLFMRFSIDAVFLDEEKRIIYLKSDLRPWTGFAYPQRRFKYLIEMKAGRISELGLKMGDSLIFSHTTEPVRLSIYK